MWKKLSARLLRLPRLRPLVWKRPAVVEFAGHRFAARIGIPVGRGVDFWIGQQAGASGGAGISAERVAGCLARGVAEGVAGGASGSG